MKAERIPDLPPLCVDCDGTLVLTDLLHEACCLLVKQSPLTLLLVPIWLLKGKSHLKMEIAKRVQIQADLLPYNKDVVDLIRSERAQGRTIVLATSAASPYADAVADHLDLFDETLATDSTRNLTGEHKATALVERFGAGNFCYVANSSDDLPVWKRSGSAIVANASPRLSRRVRTCVDTVKTLPRDQTGLLTYLKALRVHQWLKNLLVFVPIVAAQQLFNLPLLSNAIGAFIAFSFCASGVYVLNDLLDLASDRRHPTKSLRPFASGKLSIRSGIALIGAMLLLAAAVTLLLPPLFWLAIVGYFATTTAYSLWLKKQVILDVMVLAGLYTFRLLAGSAATGISPSFWLLAFSVFVFLSLAVVKRYSELLDFRGSNGEKLYGRGYRVSDLTILSSMGTSSGYLSVLVMALYINSGEVEARYENPRLLWLFLPLLLYWISRIWIKTQRREMADDPVVFAATDRISLGILAAGAVIFTAAAL